MTIDVQPGQETANTAVRQRNARIGGTIVEIDGVSIRCQRIAAWKRHVLYVTMTFIFRFRSKHPRIPPNQAFFWLLKVEEGQPGPVDGTRRRASNAMVRDYAGREGIRMRDLLRDRQTFYQVLL